MPLILIMLGWTRSCDLALLIGTFIYGFGNYEAMHTDKGLDFSSLMRSYHRECVYIRRPSRNFQCIVKLLDKHRYKEELDEQRNATNTTASNEHLVKPGTEKSKSISKYGGSNTHVSLFKMRKSFKNSAD